MGRTCRFCKVECFNPGKSIAGLSPFKKVYTHLYSSFQIFSQIFQPKFQPVPDIRATFDDYICKAQNNLFHIATWYTIEGFCYSIWKMIHSMFILSSYELLIISSLGK